MITIYDASIEVAVVGKGHASGKATLNSVENKPLALAII